MPTTPCRHENTPRSDQPPGVDDGADVAGQISRRAARERRDLVSNDVCTSDAKPLCMGVQGALPGEPPQSPGIVVGHAGSQRARQKHQLKHTATTSPSTQVCRRSQIYQSLPRICSHKPNVIIPTCTSALRPQVRPPAPRPGTSAPAPAKRTGPRPGCTHTRRLTPRRRRQCRGRRARRAQAGRGKAGCGSVCGPSRGGRWRRGSRRGGQVRALVEGPGFFRGSTRLRPGASPLPDRT